MKIFFSFLGILLSLQLSAHDEPLSEPFGSLIHPIVDEGTEVQVFNVGNGEESKSDFLKAIKYQTNVKAQGHRNTCTVFSITGLIESLILIKYPDVKDIDFSEQWLQYLVALGSPTGGANGSTVPINFGHIKKFGLSQEKHLSYNQDEWKKDSQEVLKQCQNLKGLNEVRCLFSQLSPALMSLSDANLLNKSHPNYNPNFVSARQSANESKAYLTPGISGSIVNSTSKIKNRLRSGLPLTLEINVFYGTWNHGAGKKIGIDIDNSQFQQGVINYPEKGSVDRIKSPQQLARHSVVIVGYDDNVEMTYKKLMTDGSTKTFTRKGVYYIKNSWGTKGFGKNFKFGKSRIPGFGMISQDYAHEFGQFFAIDLAGKSL